jgi:hypothetical protein
MIVAIIALVVALGGTSYAAFKLPKNSVGTRQIKKSAVTGAKLKKDAVTSLKVRDGSLTATDLQAGQLNATGPAGGDLTGTYPNPEFGPVPAVRALSSLTQTVPTATGTIMQLSGANIDEGGMFDNEQDALVVNRPGLYSIDGNIGWENNNSGSRQARIFVNDQIRGLVVDSTAGSGTVRQSVSTLVRLEAGDKVQLGGWQTSGGALDTSLASPQGAVWLSAFRVGP